MNPVEVRLKDGRIVVMRSMHAEDENKLFEMFSSLSEDAVRWGMPPYSREVIKRWISNLPHCIAIVAVHGVRIVGQGSIYKIPHPRRKGVADLGIYIHQDFQNVGLGTAMVSKLLESAKRERLHKLELGVIAENTPAIRLYEKFGFKVEGVLKDWYFGDDGKYHDHVAMGLILE
jgi:putative acetyltransferase